MHLHSFKTDEQSLVGDEIRVLVTFAKLVAAVEASAKDEDDGCGQTGKVDARSVIQRTSGTATEIADHVVTQRDNEEGQNDDLEDETGHGDVDTGLAASLADSG